MLASRPSESKAAFRSCDTPDAASCSSVLIVEDSPINRLMLRSMLSREGFCIMEAANGDEALSIVRRERPDLILLDVLLPGADGYEVCSHLKADPATAATPVIFLTALSETHDKIKGLEMGAADYITKPFSKGEVLARVRTHLAIHELRCSLKAANEALVRKQRLLDAEMKAAASIQRSLLPDPDLWPGCLRIEWCFQPCETLGGDIFNVVPLADDLIGIYVVDVSGHGVPSALVTLAVHQTLTEHSGILFSHGEPRSPAEALAQLDYQFPYHRFEKHLTACYAVIDTVNGVLRYSSAGHPPPILVRHSGQVESLTKGGAVIGLGALFPWEEGEERLGPGDRLYLYTDGITEALDTSGRQFGDRRLHDYLSRAAALDLKEVGQQLLDRLSSYRGHLRPRDDLSLLALEHVTDSS